MPDDPDRAQEGPGTGTTIGGFRIEKLIGKGGMGEVYLARQLSLDRDVALKILPSYLSATKEDGDRFLQEMRLLARLQHPHIVPAHEAGEDSGILFLAMAYVRGESLEDRVKRVGPLPEKEALLLIRKLASALAYAWNKHEMLHRDVKPSNVLLNEQGEPSLVDVVRKQLSEPLPHPRDLNIPLSDGCATLLGILLARDRSQRHRNWEAVLEDVDRVLAGGVPVTPAPPEGQSAMRSAGAPSAGQAGSGKVVRKPAARMPAGEPVRSSAPAVKTPPRKSKAPLIAVAAVVVVAIAGILGWALTRKPARGSATAAAPAATAAIVSPSATPTRTARAAVTTTRTPTTTSTTSTTATPVARIAPPMPAVPAALSEVATAGASSSPALAPSAPASGAPAPVDATALASAKSAMAEAVLRQDLPTTPVATTEPRSLTSPSSKACLWRRSMFHGAASRICPLSAACRFAS